MEFNEWYFSTYGPAPSNSEINRIVERKNKLKLELRDLEHSYQSSMSWWTNKVAAELAWRKSSELAIKKDEEQINKELDKWLGDRNDN